MLAEFFKLDKKDIAPLLRTFVEQDFFSIFPELKDSVSIVATGSIATQNYDTYSDVDLAIIFNTKEQVEKYSPLIKEYKKHIRDTGEPIQVHTPTTFGEIESALITWKQDDLLREYSQALLIVDPSDAFLNLQRRFSYYPEEIYREKILWLFAETVFQIRERLDIAVAREDVYFCEVIKVQVVRLYFNTLLFLHKKWPAFDKHLYPDVRRAAPSPLLAVAEKLLAEQDMANLIPSANQAKIQLETLLLEANLIERETDQYWLDLRPRYQVKLG
ncbi:DUF4037 domain-containing protein [Candidatus Kaiserbacteria bacterium]|nr:DUF4037 domain-containing protein [Candidatus Kaiserbacteria bacterium]